jgi:GMP synthase (glutamine-hydrolysing)
MDVEVTAASSALYGEAETGKRQTVWMSHGDEVVSLPQGFQVVARSVQGAVAAIENREMRYYGLQYHPEVATVMMNVILCLATNRHATVNGTVQSILAPI